MKTKSPKYIKHIKAMYIPIPNGDVYEVINERVCAERKTYFFGLFHKVRIEKEIIDNDLSRLNLNSDSKPISFNR